MNKKKEKLKPTIDGIKNEGSQLEEIKRNYAR